MKNQWLIAAISLFVLIAIPQITTSVLTLDVQARRTSEGADGPKTVYRKDSAPDKIIGKVPSTTTNTDATIRETTLEGSASDKIIGEVPSTTNNKEATTETSLNSLTSLHVSVHAPIEHTIQQARRRAYLTYGAPSQKSPILEESVPLEHYSHVKFFARGGLGHRLLRHAAAAYSARVKGIAIRGYWSDTVFENDTKDLFLMLFDPYTRQDFAHVSSVNKTFAYYNELGVDGASIIGSRYTGGLEDLKCLCTNDEIQVHYDFFLSLRKKYTRRDVVRGFTKQHKFADHTVFGIHIRSSGILYEPEDWVRTLMDAIFSKYPEETLSRPPLLFLTTDEPEYLTLIRNEIKQRGLRWSVVVMLHRRNESETRSEQELEKWHAMLQNSFLLSHSDVVIAGTYSSFTQSLPFYLVLERPEEERNVMDSYCEVLDQTKHEGGNKSNPILKMYCYDHMMNWCCGSGVKNPHFRKMPKFVSPEHRPNIAQVSSKAREFEPGEFLSFENGWGYGKFKKLFA